MIAIQDAKYAECEKVKYAKQNAAMCTVDMQNKHIIKTNFHDII
jgi:hypothetical protein